MHNAPAARAAGRFHVPDCNGGAFCLSLNYEPDGVIAGKLGQCACARRHIGMEDIVSKFGIACIILLSAVVTAMPVNAASPAYTLGAAIERALKVNPSLEEKIHALESARMEVGVAQSHFWPRLSLVASRNRLRNSGAVGSADELSSDSNSRGVRATLSLFAGFAHLNNLQRARIKKDIASETLRQAELELIANVQIQFFLLLQSRRDLRLVRDSIRRIEMQVGVAESLSEVGMAPYANVLQNRVELSQAQAQLINVRNSIRTCEMRLNQYLGYPPGEKVKYDGALEAYPRKVDYTENEALKLAAQHRPDIRIAQKSIETAEKALQVTAGEALPQVDLTSDWMAYSRDYADSRYEDYDRHYWTVGVNFTWTFFEGGKTAFGVERDRHRIRGLRAAYKNTLAAARTDVLKALMDIQDAREVYQNAREGAKTAEANYVMANERYKTVGALSDLISAQSRLTEAEVRISKALADFQTARVRLFFNMGLRNPTLR